MDQQDQQFLDLVKSKSPVNFLCDMKRIRAACTTARERQIVYDLRMSTWKWTVNVLVYTCLNYQPVLTRDLAYRIANDWLQRESRPRKPLSSTCALGRNRPSRKKNYRHIPAGGLNRTDWNRSSLSSRSIF